MEADKREQQRALAISASDKTPADTHDRYLRTDHLKHDLRGRSVRGGVVTVAAQFLKHLISLGAVAVLARLLTPADFGLLAMVAAFTNFLVQFKDLGLSMATVQRKELSHEQVSTLFWVNVGVGLLTALITVALAPLVAWFYGKPSLSMITLVLAPSFVLGGLTVQHQALLRRQIRLGALALVQVVSVAAGAIAGVIAAVLGAGYWALVVMQLVTAVANAVGVWAKCGWRPGRPRRGTGVRPMLFFGGALTAATLLDYLTRNLDKVLIGWRWGDVALGLYANAYRLLLLPLQQFNAPLTGVAIPVLSQLKDKPDQYRAYFRKAIELLVMVGMPVVVFNFVAADKVVLLILGEQWTGAIRIFRLLGPAAFLGSFNVATGWVFVSLGQTGRQFRWTVLGCAVVSTGFVIGLPWGAVGVAVACSICTCLLRLPAILYCYQTAPVTLNDLVKALWRPAMTSTAAGAGLYLIERHLPSAGLLVIDVAVAGLVYLTCYALAWLLTPGGRKAIRELWALAGDLRRGSSRTVPFDG